MPRSSDRSIRPAQPLKLGHTVRVAERKFVILRYQGKVPAMAGCAKCQRKFFTPSILSRDLLGTEGYLLSKFDLHRCTENQRGEQTPEEVLVFGQSKLGIDSLALTWGLKRNYQRKLAGRDERSSEFR